MTTKSQLRARLEKEIEAEVVRLFPEILQLKTHVKYWPDRIFFLPNGIAIPMEIKVPGEDPTPGQRAALIALGQSGFPTCVVDNAEDAMVYLEFHLKK